VLAPSGRECSATRKPTYRSERHLDRGPPVAGEAATADRGTLTGHTLSTVSGVFRALSS
jgi:hypothetical protein